LITHRARLMADRSRLIADRSRFAVGGARQDRGLHAAKNLRSPSAPECASD
jgi:hypothetical protein